MMHDDPNAASHPLDNPGGPRQLILFFDGTANTLSGKETDTNVLKLYENLRGHRDTRQLLYYDPGVGSPDALPATGAFDWLSRKWEWLTGLAEGAGVFDNISQGYAFLMRNYREGDQIFVFGFSRGAFTARAVAGMVHFFGILAGGNEQLFPLLMRVYFSPSNEHQENQPWYRIAWKWLRTRSHVDKDNQGDKRASVGKQIRDDFTSPEGRIARVHFIGVWDTVESVGLPGPFSQHFTSAPRIKTKRFNHVRQALSLDEHRVTFMPRLYEEQNFKNFDWTDEFTGLPIHQSLEQRWFQGVHCDVGGGYQIDEAGLSNQTLQWIHREARQKGLYGDIDAQPCARRLRHDQVLETAWWALAGLTARSAFVSVREGGVVRERIVGELDPSASNNCSRAHEPVSWPAVRIALMLGLLFLVLAGYALRGGDIWQQVAAIRISAEGSSEWTAVLIWGIDEATSSIAAILEFARAQMFVTWRGDPRAANQWLQAASSAHAIWAPLCALGFVICAAYLLAVATSRLFVRWTDRANHNGSVPRSLEDRPNVLVKLGLAPMLAFIGAIAHELCSLAAIATSGWGSGCLTGPLLVLAALGAWLCAVGLLGCLFLALFAIGPWPSPWTLKAAAPDA